jgi:broad specificity phosphatase PhoE
MNHLEGMAIHNTYFAVRHGKSNANVQGIIISRTFEGCGLTSEGVEEVQSSIDTAIMDGVVSLAEPVVIVSSRFPRAYQTASRLKESLAAPEVYLSRSLRERSFGNFEGQSTDNYRTVWANDMRSIEQTEHYVESVSKVLGRMTGFVKDIERGSFAKYQGQAKTVFLVSHGDPLQILQTVFEGINPKYHHSDIPELRTGEIRKLEWKNG